MTHDLPLDPLDELVLQCLQRLEDEGPGALEALCGENPDMAEGLRRRVAALGGAGLLHSAGDPPERLGEFRLTHRLGGGAMGVVYAALQEPLGREVALKVVRPDQLAFPEARARFQREVEVVASLSHPAIVPVYTVGEDQGVPFFVMERLCGATLAELLAELGAPPRSGAELAGALATIVERREGQRPQVSGALFEGNGVDVCLAITRHVADALDHAHRRGVLHRDVKPSNIMVTADGRALLFDFGLASARDAVRVTTSGSRVGSLAYMAPEAVAGETVNPATDVYGLGAALCEALSGQPPHAELRGESLVRAILLGDPVALRARRRGLSRDVETVCRKALERDPARRYSDAEAFSRDLAHLLAHRPIEARRAGAFLRSALWCRRHPARAVALVLAMALPSSVAWQRGVSAERVAAQRDRAEQNLDRAVDALQVFLADVGSNTLRHVPRMESARLELLEQALAFLEEILPQRPDDPALLLRWGRVQRSRAEALDQLGRIDQALEAVREQIAVLSARESSGTLTLEQRIHLQGAHNLRGNLCERQGQVVEAIAAWRKAEQLLDAHEDDPLWAERTVIHRNLARVLAEQGRGDEALAASLLSVQAAEALAARGSLAKSSSDLQLALGAALANRAGLLAELQQPSKVATPLRRALVLLLALADEFPERPDIANETASATVSAVNHLPDAEALMALDHGLALAEKLADDYPHSPAYARTLCKCRMSRGMLSLRMGALGHGLSLLKSADAQANELLDSAPADFDTLYLQGLTGLNLATLLVQTGQRTEAVASAARAAAALDRALTLRPWHNATPRHLAWSLLQEGYGRVASGEWEQAVEQVRRAPELVPEDASAHVARAEVLALASTLAPSDSRHALVERALQALARGLALGFGDLAYLRSCSELASVRELPRFKDLLSGSNE